ncbi:hypothetical protein, partial [Laspinema olomoucense]|uniref:hypothetical protein n=1 Tax=Laspinema olomoucense TaxID=3231600 RepID=UPI0021BA8A60
MQKTPILHNFSCVLTEKATFVILFVATFFRSFLSESSDILEDSSKSQKFLLVSSTPKFWMISGDKNIPGSLEAIGKIGPNSGSVVSISDNFSSEPVADCRYSVNNSMLGKFSPGILLELAASGTVSGKAFPEVVSISDNFSSEPVADCRYSVNNSMLG